MSNNGIFLRTMLLQMHGQTAFLGLPKLGPLEVGDTFLHYLPCFFIRQRLKLEVTDSGTTHQTLLASVKLLLHLFLQQSHGDQKKAKQVSPTTLFLFLDKISTQAKPFFPSNSHNLHLQIVTFLLLLSQRQKHGISNVRMRMW